MESWYSCTPGSLRSALTRAVATSCCSILVPQGLGGRGAGTDLFGYFNVRLGNQKPQLFPPGADEIHGTAGSSNRDRREFWQPLRSLPSHGHSQNNPLCQSPVPAQGYKQGLFLSCLWLCGGLGLQVSGARRRANKPKAALCCGHLDSAFELPHPTTFERKPGVGWGSSSSALLRPISGGLIYFPFMLPSCWGGKYGLCSIIPLPNPQPSPLPGVLCRSLLSLQLAGTAASSALQRWQPLEQNSQKPGPHSDSSSAGTTPGPLLR